MPCFICSVPILEKNLKVHQEKCGNMTKVRNDPPSIKRKPPPKALPKLVYNLLKDTELRKKCKEFGVNSKGEKIHLKAHTGNLMEEYYITFRYNQ